MGTRGTTTAHDEPSAATTGEPGGRRVVGGRAGAVGRQWVLVAGTLAMVAALVVAVAAIGPSTPQVTSGAGLPGVGLGGAGTQPGAAQPSGGASVGGALPAVDSMSYGLAEPAGSLPGVVTPSDIAAWSQIRSDVAGSGACWLRSDLDSWLAHAIQAFDWLGSSAPCSASSSSPVKVLAILDSQTVWAAPHLCPDATFSASYGFRRRDFTLDDWRQIVSCVARTFAGRISAYEIWNEPLLPNSILGYEDGSAGHYFDLLRVAHDEIKAADPAATVIALGGSDVYAGGDEDRLGQMRAFSTDLVALGARHYADAISLHAYPWGRFDSAVWASYRQELGFQEGVWGKPVWITETGQRATDGATQAAYMNAAYSLFRGAGVGHIFWFSITDQPDGDFGLRGRPVEAALRAFALGGAPGATAGPAGQADSGGGGG